MVESLYIHIPFCSYKCPYCDFLSLVNPHIDHWSYLELLLRELELYQDIEIEPKTLYLGGGTPSLISPKLYKRFLEEMSKRVNLSSVEEVTIECNPENYSFDDLLMLLRDIGFNRISFGVQSLREEGLRALGRAHSPEDALRAIELAHRAGFENINADFIFGYHGQTLSDLELELKLLDELPLMHLSFYLLTPYEDTQIGKLYSMGLLNLPDGDTVADMYELVCERLEALGYEHYEISNFARPGFRCKHNLVYWDHREFLGLGVSSWSFIGSVRFGNTRNLQIYTNALKEGRRPVEYGEVLYGEEAYYDYLFVKLRTKDGVRLEELPPLPEDILHLFEIEGERARLSRRGMLLFNEVMLRLRDSILKV
ncbi:MAG: radical SAM family heme chaperone HemW [Acidobacteria bacterium]|jgi:oxygen-independent coproporphyrinogen-3 oxidase|nr:MAG: radical SAM family heme chaperone HemW [Acidobacteriota bacterium]